MTADQGMNEQEQQQKQQRQQQESSEPGNLPSSSFVSCSQAELLEALDSGLVASSWDGIYIYSPMCGTCKLAEQMLTIVAAAMSELRLAKLNVQSAREAAERLRIQSVPCLLLWSREAEQVVQESDIQYVYAFHSVTYLYERLKGGRADD
ncbi:thioredoxin family protein [Paenibacillus sp. 481]|uniref:thioredoxin family protein n=1 Tax=Paenibacillus sp. 481 TaxID=2835869 RepID=UPI001E3E616B|nr:thioredoxin family protein [Paenibacillus sp. 481]